MKKLLLLFVLLICALFTYAEVNSSHIWVNGYYRSDGTYVKGHYKTSPNSSTEDNFSSKGNINPYTRKIGTK